MELVGNENRIRALFSELSFADQIRAPRFDELWLRAANTRPEPVRNFHRPAIAFAVVAIVTVCAFVAWSWSNTINLTEVNALNLPSQLTTPPPIPTASQSNDSPRQTKRSHPLRKKRVEPSPPSEAAFTEAAMLWSWQSPTSILMQSPTAAVLNSLPQLNQSAEELKQFLPKDHEVTKESNQ
jgi:hypothetical protein